MERNLSVSNSNHWYIQNCILNIWLPLIAREFFVLYSDKWLFASLKAIWVVYHSYASHTHVIPLRYHMSLSSKLKINFHFELMSICLSSFLWSSPRPISDSQLHVLPHFHLCPIYLVVFKGSYWITPGISYLKGGFTLRCLQRLSLPNLATLLCHWYDNRLTSGSSSPVLSY